MKRREFLKGAILSTALLASGEALATEGYSIDAPSKVKKMSGLK